MYSVINKKEEKNCKKYDIILGSESKSIILNHVKPIRS